MTDGDRARRRRGWLVPPVGGQPQRVGGIVYAAIAAWWIVMIFLDDGWGRWIRVAGAVTFTAAAWHFWRPPQTRQAAVGFGVVAGLAGVAVLVLVVVQAARS